jgi:hypothetical protein
MTTFYYMPHHPDPDLTGVGGVSFEAYEPVELNDKAQAELINRLRLNPWFGENTIDAERKALWQTARAEEAELKRRAALAPPGTAPVQRIRTMATITYQPHYYDADETQVEDIKFKAYEPVDVGENRRDLVHRLKSNPWFTLGEVDAKRKALWAAAREQSRLAQEHAQEAARLLYEPPVVAELPPAPEPQPPAAEPAAEAAPDKSKLN